MNGPGLQASSGDEEIAMIGAEDLVARTGEGADEATDQLHRARAAENERGIEPVYLGNRCAQLAPVRIGIERGARQRRRTGLQRHRTGSEGAFVLGQ
jgi:hypothetical protein